MSGTETTGPDTTGTETTGTETPHTEHPRTGTTAAVVGANGFLGRAMVTALRAGGVRVARFTRENPCLSSGGPAPGLIEADTVIWAAASVNPAIAEIDPAAVVRDRQVFDDVLGALSTRPGRRRVVLLSSGGTVYDPAGTPPYDETAATAPVGAYGRAKLTMERALGAAASGPPLEAVVLRLSNAYGPGQPVGRGQGVIAHWLAAAGAGRPLTLIGDPATSRDYVYVGDVARAVLRVHDHPGPVPAVVNIGSGVPTRLDELARIVLRVVGAPGLAWDSEPGRGFDVPRTWLDVTRAREAMGWSCEVGLPEGIGRTWRAGQDSIGRGDEQA